MKKLLFAAFLALSNLILAESCESKNVEKAVSKTAETTIAAEKPIEKLAEKTVAEPAVLPVEKAVPEVVEKAKTPPVARVQKPKKAAPKKVDPFYEEVFVASKTPAAEPILPTKKDDLQPPEMPDETAFDFSLFDALLKKNVSETGRVDYQNLKKEAAELAKIVAQFEAVDPEKLASKNEKLAFWLNAYNLFTLDLVVKNWPLKKITDLDGGKTWDVKRIEIGGKKLSLNDIENTIIRPKFNDARIHFAINCAAKSCPPLLNEAFSAENVQELLAKRTRKFVRSSANSITENTIEVSRIFEWYAKDFGDLPAFLNRYSTVKIAADAKLIFKDYDWSIND